MQAEWKAVLVNTDPSHVIPISCLSAGYIRKTLYALRMSTLIIRAPLPYV